MKGCLNLIINMRFNFNLLNFNLKNRPHLFIPGAYTIIPNSTSLLKYGISVQSVSGIFLWNISTG